MAYTIVTEIYYDGAWHDISADVRNRDPVTITRGRLDESSRTEPGSMTFTLNNGRSRINDVVGRYSPRNPSSDLFGLIGRNTPVRQSVDGMRRFNGEISEWPVRWGLDGEDVTVTIQAYGILRRLGQGGGTGVRSPFARQLELLGPEAYWPLDSEGPEIPAVGASAVGGSPFLLSSSSVGLTVGRGDLSPWAGTGLLVGPGGSADPTVTSAITGNFAADVSMAAPVGNYEWCLDFLVRFPDGTAPVGDETGAEGTVNLSWYLTGNGSPRLDWHILFSTDFADTRGITVSVIDGATSAILSTVGFIGPHLADGEMHHVSLGVARGSSAYTWSAFVDGEGASGQGWTGSGTYPAQGVARVNFNYVGRTPRPAPVALGQMAIRSGAFTGSVASLPALTEAAGRGHYLEPAGRRIERLCAENAVPFRGVGDLDDTEPLGHQYAAPLLDLLEQAGETDGGILFEDRGPVNLLVDTDGTFEDGVLSPWTANSATAAVSTEQAHSGTRSLKVTSTVATGGITANASALTTVEPGEVLTGSCWVRAHTENLTGGRVTLIFRDSGGAILLTTDGPLEFLFNGLWSLHSHTAVAPVGSVSCEFRFRATVVPSFGVGTGFYLDDAVLTWGVVGSSPIDTSAPSGLVYATRRGLYNRPTLLPLDYAGTATKGGHVSDLTPADDDQAIANDVTCQRPNGGSRQAVKVTGPLSVAPAPEGIGRYDRAVSRNVPRDDRLALHAEAIVNLGTIDKTRYPDIAFRPRKFPELTPRAAAVDCGDVVTVDNLPAWLPPEAIKGMALGYTEQYSIADWSITYNTRPEEPYVVGVLDVDRLDTDRATVASAFPARAPAVTDFEAGQGTWVTSHASVIAAVDATVAHSGTKSLKVTRITTNGIWQIHSGLAADPKAVTPVTPGERITTALWVRHNAAAPVSLLTRHRYFNGTTFVSQSDAANALIPANAWTLLTYTSTAPAAIDGMNIAVISTTGPVVGESMWVDDVYAGRSSTPITLPVAWDGSNCLQVTGDFEAGLGTWTDIWPELTTAIDATVAHSGAQSLKQTRTTSAGGWEVRSGTDAQSKAVTGLTPGDQLSTSVWVRHNSASSQTIWLRHNYYNNDTYVSGPDNGGVSVSTATWTLLEYTSTVPATANGMHFMVTSAAVAVGEVLWVDDVRAVFGAALHPVDLSLAAAGASDYEVEAAGVVLHVVEVVGATSPQTFVVDPIPLNGVAKEIPAGSAVHLAKPWRLAF